MQLISNLSFSARSARTSLMPTNQGKRKRGTNRITAKKCLRHFEDCGILNIKKDICVNRCPTGATDRRLARLFSHKIAVTFGRVGGYFCVLLLSLLPMAYPRPKQVRHKPSTEINPSIVNIRFSPPFPDSVSGFYVIGGSQSLQRGLTAYHLGSPKEILPYFDKNFYLIFTPHREKTPKTPAIFFIKSCHWHF